MKMVNVEDEVGTMDQTTKVKKMSKMLDELSDKDNDELEPFETDSEILEKIGIDLTPEELELINTLMYEIDKKISEDGGKALMYR